MISISIVGLEVVPILVSNKRVDRGINGMGRKNSLMMGYLLLLISNSGFSAL